jgi:anti-anti-sigma regulatory factor
MSQKFQAAVHHRDDMSFVKLGGVIDEDNELTELTGKLQGSTVIIDVGEVERINSCGVRDWVNWLGRVEGKDTEIVLIECSPAIVAQINLVNNFTGSGVVKSFYVPYFCPECDEEKVLLCDAADLGPPPHEPPTCRCDECDLVMDFDDMPDSYFAFLGTQKKVARPDKIQSVIDEFASNDDGKSKIRSRVGSQNISSGGLPSRSLPTVPSLPSISRTPTTGGPFVAGSSSPDSLLGSGSISTSGVATVKQGGTLVYGLVGVLLVALVVLGVLLFTS